LSVALANRAVSDQSEHASHSRHSGRNKSTAFAAGVLIATFYGTLLAVFLARCASRPARTFTLIAAIVTALSLITPLDGFGASLSTKLSLAAGHLIVASIMTPTLRRGISRAQA
jgi:predicted membrane metal-binding protein